jgi:hypothetical protein
MLPHGRRPLAYLVGIAVAAVGAAILCTAGSSQDAPADSPRSSGLVLLLAPATQTIKAGQTPKFTATVVNRGKQTVTLVEPGDGSECGWRTPLIEWLPRRPGRVARCGNINALRANEVFTLKPGQSRALSEWIGQPPLPGPGRHKVRLRYVNEPTRPWLGAPLGKHDPEAMKAVQRSTPLAIASNSVEVVVER